MQKAKVIAKQPPMPPADKAAAGLVHRVRTARILGGISRCPRGEWRGMTREIRNPAKLPADLNPAEKRFARCLAAGESCIIGDGELPKEGIESGEGANVVRGEVIRFFAYGGDKEHLVRGAIIDLRGAWICGKEAIDLKHANIPYALAFFRCHFTVDVDIRHAECVALYLDGSRLARGLEGAGLMTKGSVNLRNDFFAEGEVQLLGANIGGTLDCDNGKFNNPGSNAISADGLMTKGNVHLRRGFSAEGAVRLLGAKIGGELSCTGGKFHNTGGNALHADGLTTKSNVHLLNGFSAKGEVRLLGVNIGRNLSCAGGEFYNPGGKALNVDGGSISGCLFWRKTTCEGDVVLAYARVDVLADDPDSWKSCKVNLDGFIYNRFSNPMDFQFRLRWLGNRPDRIKFSPLPYEQAAKALFGMGRASDAREILLKKERLQTKDGKMPWLQRVGRRLWNVFAGYGYRLRYTAAWMLGVVVVGTVIFGAADWHSNIVPTHPVVALSDGYKMQVAPDGDMRPTQAALPEYPAFNPLVFSLDVFTPSAVFHQEDSWGPRSGGGDWKDFDVDILWFLTLWYWLEVAMGWILTSMLLLSITGLLRPRQSSGERD